MPEPNLTARQQKYFASLQASLERDTGRNLAEWVTIARTCPETAHRARLKWLKDNHGLLQNHGRQVLDEAFPPELGWDAADQMRARLWTDPASTAIFAALERAVTLLPELITGQRRAYTAWSRNFQFAAAKPAKGGAVVLGLAVEPAASDRLAAPKNEGWSERLKSKLALASPADIDGEVAALLRASWERS